MALKREYWRKRFVEREKRMLAYFNNHPIGKTHAETPDGSFMMSAFMLGRESAIRAMKRNKRGLEEK